ncbi:deoxyribodipyrimidine photo-lyase [Capronia coronata CBS 617.96]|uniref:Deoxyribodipyrimidine photo-lyase n=1 Tax=Capronia coronata CBS 617.96 TaxID=1182541 RepID=W9Y1B9_9EURO|nr:deoxyribodipyrimidine photo-lyase [Capronia coronata CBS 617.96]EXJ86283.1 deoxyribodipyrimidine photo-lyase [Capronia coronata CBS 617.96]
MTGPKRKADVAFPVFDFKKPLAVPTYCTKEIKYGIVLRKYYPPEITNARADEYRLGQLERPVETLENALQETRAERNAVHDGKSVVHWFKSDLRVTDNKGLYAASVWSREHAVPLICVYLVSPQDFEAHLTAPVRVDFILRNLQVLKHDLAKLNIPLYVETIEKRRNVPSRLMELCNDWSAKHVFCNIEYEIDEVRREAALVRACLSRGISFNPVEDRCVVAPGKLISSSGGPMSVYSPWHRKWCDYLNRHFKELDPFPAPDMNAADVWDRFEALFRCEIPPAPASKSLSENERAKFRVMWPAGEHEARERLDKFIQERAREYHSARNIPSANATSILSPHLAAGTLAARTVVREARDAAPNKKLMDDRKQGHSMWIGELAFRDFYTSILCYWPYICMNKPFKPEYSNIEWEYDLSQFEKWTDGRTGLPIVDAAMRQLTYTGYMHNRCRMLAASFLAKDLLIDWRMGERWFMEHLVDGDFASNNGGWGFAASCGADPQPYFRIFNPLLQSEKFDPQGDYIRKWVPELADIRDEKGIHDPYGRGYGKVAEANGYPKPMVNHHQCRERALQRYKAGLGRSTA